MTVTPLAEALYQAALMQMEPGQASEARTLWQLANRHDAVPPLVWPEVIEPYAGVRIAPGLAVGANVASSWNALDAVMGATFVDARSAVLPPAGAR